MIRVTEGVHGQRLAVQWLSFGQQPGERVVERMLNPRGQLIPKEHQSTVPKQRPMKMMVR